MRTRLKQLSIDGAALGDVVAYNGGNWAPQPEGAGDDVGDYTNLPGAVALRDVVYISGADTVALADADDPAKVPAIGVVVAIIDPTNCRVQLQGEVGGFGGLVPNTDYYLDTAAGGITAAPPIAPGSIVQKIGRARDATTLVVETDLDYLVN